MNFLSKFIQKFNDFKRFNDVIQWVILTFPKPAIALLTDPLATTT
jgi:hypothetical protein